MSEQRKQAIGIDLGTTFSVVAVTEPGQRVPKVVPNRHGVPLTPSVVAVGRTNGQMLVGKEAKDRQQSGEPGVMAFGKREMGNTEFLFPAGNGRHVSAEEFSAAVLKTVAADAAARLGTPVQEAVVTVPAYFMAEQRDATLRAAQAAGLKVARIINEPTAAALAFVAQFQVGGLFLVYDWGGGTFDVAVAEVVPEAQRFLVNVRRYKGDSMLGGRDIDETIIQYVRHQVRERHGVELLSSPADDARWAIIAEQTKVKLGTAPAVDIAYAAGDHKGTVRLTREEFESRYRHHLNTTLRLCDEALSEAGVRWADLTDVLLVGGSSRLQAVRDRLAERLGRPPRSDLNPDEVVAVGAAICAAGEAGFGPAVVLAQERVAHNLGLIVKLRDEDRWENSVLLPANTIVGEARTREYTIKRHETETSRASIYLTQGGEEGCDPNDPSCRCLGRYMAEGVGRGTGDARVNITFRFNNNGTVEIAGKDLDGPDLTITKVEIDDPPWMKKRAPSTSKATQEKPTAEMETIFTALGLLADASVDQLKKALEQSRLDWSAQVSNRNDPKARVRLGQVQFFRQALADPEALERERGFARAEEAARRQRVADALQRSVGADGGLTPEAVLAVADATRTTPDYVRKMAAELGYEVVGPAPKVNYPTLPPDVAKDVRDKLKALQMSSLYQMVGAAPQLPREEVLSRVKKAIEGEQFNSGSDESRVRLALLNRAADLFAKPDEKKLYDNTLALENLRTRFEARALAMVRDSLLKAAQRDELLTLMNPVEGPEAAVAFLQTLAREQHFKVEGTSKGAPKPTVICSRCGHLNSFEAATCQRCKSDLRPKCPGCGNRNRDGVLRCGYCNFDLHERGTQARAAFLQATRAFEAKDFAAARFALRKLEDAWPGHEEGRALLAKVNATENASSSIFEQVEQLQRERRHVEALKALEKAPEHDRRTKLRAVSQQAVAQAAKLIAEGDAKRTSQPDQAYELYQQALEACADSSAAEKQRGCPPSPVPSVKAEVANGVLTLTWPPSPSRFGNIDYRVVATDHRIPEGPDPKGPEDGRIIGTLRFTAGSPHTVATSLTAGVPVYAAIYARRNGEPALTAAVAGPVLYAPPVKDLHWSAGAGRITLTYSAEPAAIVEVVRETKSGDAAVTGGVTNTTAVDLGLPDGVPVTYRVTAKYRNADGSWVSSAACRVTAHPGAPEQPPGELLLEIVGEELLATVTAAPGSEVHLYASDRPPTFAAGQTIAQTALAGLGKFIPIHQGTARWKPAAGVEVHVVPVTLIKNRAVMGAAKSACIVGAVSKLTIAPPDAAGRARVEFPWPAGASKVVIHVTAPSSFNGRPPSTMELKARETKEMGWVEFTCPAGAPVVEVAAVASVAVGGKPPIEAPACKRIIAYASRRTLYYRIVATHENDREEPRLRLAPKWWRSQPDRGRIKQVRVVIVPDAKVKLPEIGLFYAPGDRRPLRVSDSDLVAQLRPADTSYSPSLEGRFEETISLDSMLEPGCFRLFPLNEADALGWRLIDVPDLDK